MSISVSRTFSGHGSTVCSNAAAAANVPTIGVFGPSYPNIYSPWGNHTAYAQTPETFDQLIDFEGYNPKTLDKTLMNSLKTDQVIYIIDEFLKLSNANNHNPETATRTSHS